MNILRHGLLLVAACGFSGLVEAAQVWSDDGVSRRKFSN